MGLQGHASSQAWISRGMGLQGHGFLRAWVSREGRPRHALGQATARLGAGHWYALGQSLYALF